MPPKSVQRRSNPVGTPVVPDNHVALQERDNSEYMDKHDASRYRVPSARLNYLSLDRLDLQFAAKKASRYMATPRVSGWALLKRTARNLMGCPRSVQTFRWQIPPSMVTTFTDSDGAGDRSRRKSTSGGVVCLGHHVIKSWSSTQQLVALSSGKAELYALIKGASQTRGIISMLVDYGLTFDGTVCTDASAAMGISCRRGFRPHSPFGRPIPFDSRKGGRGTSESRQSCNPRESGPIS